jgi:hypothetical protein
MPAWFAHLFSGTVPSVPPPPPPWICFCSVGCVVSIIWGFQHVAGH